RQLKQALPHLEGVRAAETGAVIEQLEKSLAELPAREDEYLERLVHRYSEDAPFYVPLEAETTEKGEIDGGPGRTGRRQRRRAMADYCEWIPAQREVTRVKLRSLEEGVSKYLSIVLLGDPGSGKTTAIEMLALRVAEAIRAN